LCFDNIVLGIKEELRNTSARDPRDSLNRAPKHRGSSRWLHPAPDLHLAELVRRRSIDTDPRAVRRHRTAAFHQDDPAVANPPLRLAGEEVGGRWSADVGLRPEVKRPVDAHSVALVALERV